MANRQYNTMQYDFYEVIPFLMNKLVLNVVNNSR